MISSKEPIGDNCYDNVVLLLALPYYKTLGPLYIPIFFLIHEPFQSFSGLVAHKYCFHITLESWIGTMLETAVDSSMAGDSVLLTLAVLMCPHKGGTGNSNKVRVKRFILTTKRNV